MITGVKDPERRQIGTDGSPLMLCEDSLTFGFLHLDMTQRIIMLWEEASLSPSLWHSALYPLIYSCIPSPHLRSRQAA